MLSHIYSTTTEEGSHTSFQCSGVPGETGSASIALRAHTGQSITRPQAQAGTPSSSGLPVPYKGSEEFLYPQQFNFKFLNRRTISSTSGTPSLTWHKIGAQGIPKGGRERAAERDGEVQGGEPGWLRVGPAPRPCFCHLP